MELCQKFIIILRLTKRFLYSLHCVSACTNATILRRNCLMFSECKWKLARWLNKSEKMPQCCIQHNKDHTNKDALFKKKIEFCKFLEERPNVRLVWQCFPKLEIRNTRIWWRFIRVWRKSHPTWRQNFAIYRSERILYCFCVELFKFFLYLILVYAQYWIRVQLESWFETTAPTHLVTLKERYSETFPLF